MQTLINHAGEIWEVEHRTSERLAHIGGYLVLCGELNCVVISEALSTKRNGADAMRCSMKHSTKADAETSASAFV